VKVKTTAGFPFFVASPSDRTPMAKKDVNVHFFIHGINSCKLYQRIPGTFSSSYVWLVKEWAKTIYHTTIKSTLVPTQDRRAQLSLICTYRCTIKPVKLQQRRVQNALKIPVQEFTSRKLCVKMSHYKREVYNRR
jgi:hypothetical protein